MFVRFLDLVFVIFCSSDTLQKFDRAATIADFVVSMLCNLDRPQTSPQNAASWGYFDAENNRFEENLLREADFPIGMLPQVRPDNGVAGTLKRPWHGIPSGVIVGKWTRANFSKPSSRIKPSYVRPQVAIFRRIIIILDRKTWTFMIYKRNRII